MKKKTPFPMTPFDMLVVPGTAPYDEAVSSLSAFRHPKDAGTLDQMSGTYKYDCLFPGLSPHRHGRMYLPKAGQRHGTFRGASSLYERGRG